MSTDITNTSSRLPADDSMPRLAEGGALQEDPRLSTLASSLPDVAVIAKLANELFAALPENPVKPASEPPTAVLRDIAAPPPDSSAVASQVPTAAQPPQTPSVPLYFLGATQVSPWSADFTFPANGQLEALPGTASATSLNLGVDALPTRSVSPSSASGITSQIPTAVQPPGIPGLAAIAAGQERGALPVNTHPVLASNNPSSLPSSADLSGTHGIMSASSMPLPEPHAATCTAISAPPQRVNEFAEGPPTSPWNSDIDFPAPTGMFSFPLIPDFQLSPEPPTTQPFGDIADLRDIPLELIGPSPLAPHMPGQSSRWLEPEAPPYFADAQKSVALAAEVKLEAGSELLSFPNVPGLQSSPSNPSIPSSLPSSTGSNQPLADNANAVQGSKRASQSAVPDLQLSKHLFDPHAIRRDFPILREQVHGKPLIWLDNAATTQKPQSVIDRISHFYQHENSNIHRAAHALAARATDAYESAREKVRRFLNASSTREIVFVRGATEAINLAAQSWGKRHLYKDDEVVISWIEHHSNIVPWQMLCAEKGAKLRVAPVDDDGQIILSKYEKLLNPRTKLVALTHVSNALGTILPVREMIQMAHRYGARVLIDGAQAIAHMRVDVQALDCDFYVFSGHKVFGPTGIGVLYGKPDALAEAPPWQGGGNMITDVTFEKSEYQHPPARFEAGTGNIADAVGLGAALDYLEQIGMENITLYEHELLVYAMKELRKIPGLRLVGTAREKASVVSFVLDSHRNEDIGLALDREGIAVRTGHHCAQPALRRFGLESAVRPSLALYNTFEDIEALVAAVRRLQVQPF